MTIETMTDSMRATGRTSRMLTAAIKDASEPGAYVFVIAGTLAQAKDMARTVAARAAISKAVGQ